VNAGQWTRIIVEDDGMMRPERPRKVLRSPFLYAEQRSIRCPAAVQKRRSFARADGQCGPGLRRRSGAFCVDAAVSS